MKIVYTYRVVCQKLSAPSSGPTLPTASWPRGTSAAASRSYSLSPTYRWTAPSSRPSHAAAPPPSSTLSPAGRGRGCHRRVKPSAPKGSDQGRGAPLCRVPIAQGTPLTCCSRQAQSLPGVFAVRLFMRPPQLACQLLLILRRVKKSHSWPIEYVGATIGRPPTWRSNAFSG